MEENTLEPRSGSVSRRGGDLIVVAPTGMPRSAWLSLAQEFLLQTGASDDGERRLVVPVENAADVADILGRPWPAGRWKWDWTLDARAAAGSASTVQDAVDRILATPPVRDQGDLDSALLEAGFARQLLPAQRDAVAQLVSSGGGGNFSVPGSGKTTMTYAVYTLLRAAGLVDRMLVIAPQSAYEAWENEARDCYAIDRVPTVELAPASPSRRSEVLIFNYERAAQPGTRAAIDAWSHGHRFAVVFDEAHRAKRGKDGLHGFGAADLAGIAAARLVLTGTPMPNGPEDLVAILELAWPGQGARLASMHTPHANRSWTRITKDQLGLEEAVIEIEPVRLDDAHMRLYEALVGRLKDDPELQADHPEYTRSAVTRIIACASNPALLDSAVGGELVWPRDIDAGRPLPELIADTRAATRPAKLLAAARYAADYASRGEKLLIWTNFIGNINELERLLDPYRPAVITGATPRHEPSAPTDRERELRRFRQDPECAVLLATPQTLGEGVSLHHACQTQLHVDRTFNAGLFLQALDRTHRVGMPEGTRAKAIVLQAIGTIDERIDEAMRQKLQAMDEMLNDPTLARLARVKAGPAAGGFSRAELADLLRHLA
ncbi:SNF2-related protein [Microbacterium sp. NPDC089698]|uniref:SNF2-related protein n=1 Tax=Microbacterium sp. NPDC089698 TaxID=3364200 RepID=UPI00380FC1CD